MRMQLAMTISARAESEDYELVVWARDKAREYGWTNAAILRLALQYMKKECERRGL